MYYICNTLKKQQLISWDERFIAPCSLPTSDIVILYDYPLVIVDDNVRN